MNTVTLSDAALALLSDLMDVNDDDDELATNSGASLETIAELHAAVEDAVKIAFPKNA